MRKNLFGTEIFDAYAQFIEREKLIKEQKEIEKKLSVIKENEQLESNCSPYAFFHDKDGDKIYSLPFDGINTEFQVYKFSKENEEFENFLNSCLSHGEGIETEDGSIYWASDLFDALKHYDSLYDNDDLDENKDSHIKNINNELPIGDLEFSANKEDDEDLDEVMAGKETNDMGQAKPIFKVVGSSIMEENEMYPSEIDGENKVYKMPFNCDSIEDLLKLSDKDEELNKFLRGVLGAEDKIETGNGNIYKGSDIFDYILNSQENDTDETFKSIKKEWEGATDDDHDDIDVDMEDDGENINLGEPLPKKNSIEEDLSKKMDKKEAKEIAETIKTLSEKEQKLNESFNRMKFLIDIEKYR